MLIFPPFFSLKNTSWITNYFGQFLKTSTHGNNPRHRIDGNWKKLYWGWVCLHVRTQRTFLFKKTVLLLCSPKSCPITTTANQEEFHLTTLTYANGEKAQINEESQSWLPKDLYKIQRAWKHVTSVLSIWFYHQQWNSSSLTAWKLRPELGWIYFWTAYPRNLKSDPEWRKRTKKQYQFSHYHTRNGV